jgi:hypothetical protein
MANATNQSSTRSHHPDRPAIELPIVAPSGIALAEGNRLRQRNLGDHHPLRHRVTVSLACSLRSIRVPSFYLVVPFLRNVPGQVSTHPNR